MIGYSFSDWVTFLTLICCGIFVAPFVVCAIILFGTAGLDRVRDIFNSEKEKKNDGNT